MVKILPHITERPAKARNAKITQDLLDERHAWSKRLGYQKQKWVHFCEIMLAAGFDLYLYEAQRTVSKYITITDGFKSFKVRFSDHRPIAERESRGDCDFFVGRTNLAVTTTEDAIGAVGRFFNG